MKAQPRRMSLSEMGVWGAPVRVEFGDGWEEVWVQTVGDRTEALERGHEAMQRKLLEFRAGTERAEALTEALMLAPTCDLIDLIVEGERAAAAARARREMRDPVCPRQDAAAGETEEQFARRVAEHTRRCEEVAAARAARVEELLRARREELAALPREKLVELARPRRVDIECWNAFAAACDDWVLLRAVRRAEDHAQQYFSDISELQRLHPAVREQLKRAYRALEPEAGADLPKCCCSTGVSGSTS
jgi:hypothetical protein